MKYDKSFLRNQFLAERKRKHLSIKNFNFNLVYNLIKKNFFRKNITIAGYYPANHEVNILKFLEDASSKKFKIVLAVIKSSKNMVFKKWIFKQPL